MRDRVFLSIVIPAYNEESRLPASLQQVIDFATSQTYPVEVIVVNNNSQDRTRQIADGFADRYDFVRVMDQPIQGKGAAVKVGMLMARGEYRLIADADLSMPVSEIPKFLPPNLSGYDIAIGSRELPDSVRINEPAYRHLMGRVFSAYVKAIAIPGIEDTQCGFKCFHQFAAVSIFPLQTITGFAFDVELLMIARRGGFKVVEVPIEWHHYPNSKVSPLRDALRMTREVARIRNNARHGLYDSARPTTVGDSFKKESNHGSALQ
jgi:dolichyl-phosphate beta-glucosyltransferase